MWIGSLLVSSSCGKRVTKRPLEVWGGARSFIRLKQPTRGKAAPRAGCESGGKNGDRATWDPATARTRRCSPPSRTWRRHQHIKSLQFSTECKRNITLPQHIRGDLRIQRMDFGRIVDLLLLLLKENVVGILLDGVVVQVEGALEEGGTGARQMRARRPEPSRHVARRRRRDVVAQSQWLLQ